MNRTVWFNVTSSIDWKRPPVGIIRVEQSLMTALRTLYNSQEFRLCAWHEGRFVEVCASNGEFIAKEYNLNSGPGFGDVLISVGLDWDKPYTHHFSRLREQGVLLVTCCYDLIPVLYPQYCVGEVAQHFTDYFVRVVWSSDLILCISKTSERDLHQLMARIGGPRPNTVVIELGDNVPSGVEPVSAAIKELAEDAFVLFVSTIERRKNHEVLYRAYHLLGESGRLAGMPKLVFVGMHGWGVGDLLKDIELDPLTRGKIIQLNHINDSELRLLYDKAQFCVYPSLYEGWGLPVGEALALGKAVIASNRGSLPEVGGDFVTYVDPWNAQAWADCMYGFANSPEAVQTHERRTRQEYVPRTWAQCGETVMKAISALPILASDLVLYPGYDMSTQVGVHQGPLIISTGKEGFLLFGPHRPLAAGSYRVKLWHIPTAATHGKALIEVVSQKGTVTHFHTECDFSANCGAPAETILCEFEVSIASALQDFELRCVVESGELTVARIEIVRTSPSGIRPSASDAILNLGLNHNPAFVE